MPSRPLSRRVNNWLLHKCKWFTMHKDTYTQINTLFVIAQTYVQAQSHLQHREQNSWNAPHPSCSLVSSQCEAGCTPTPHPGSSPVEGSVMETQKSVNTVCLLNLMYASTMSYFSVLLHYFHYDYNPNPFN